MTTANEAQANNEKAYAAPPRLIYSKIIAVMRDIEAIGKNRKNVKQDFMFRGIDDVYNMLHALFSKHGIFTVPTVTNRQYSESTSKSGTVMVERILTVRYRFYADDGSFVEAEVDGEAMDSGDKASSKCLAIAHKYALLQVFCIPTEGDNDPDAHTPEPREEKPRRTATTVKAEPTPAAPVNRQPDKQQVVLAKAQALLLPLVRGSGRYQWAMDKIFGSHDWNEVATFSLRELDEATRGRIAEIIERAKAIGEEELDGELLDKTLEKPA